MKTNLLSFTTRQACIIAIALLVALPPTLSAAESPAVEKMLQARTALTGNQKDFAKAKKLLLDIVKTDKDTMPSETLCYVYVYLGYIEDHQNNRENAVGWYRKAVALPNTDRVKECAELGLKEPMTWIRHLDEGTTAAPGGDWDSVGYKKLGPAQAALTGKQKNLAKAKNLLLDLLEKDKDTLGSDTLCYVYVYLGYIEDQQNNHEQAVEWYKKAVACPKADGVKACAEQGLKEPMTWIRHLDEGTPPPRPQAESARGKTISLATAPPVVLKTEPVAGSIDVDPNLTEIRVTFSKLMQDQSWSWSTWGKENYPESTGMPHYLADSRTCVLPVKLQPGKFYAIWLNSERFHGFQDTSQISAVPYLLTFTTAGSAEAGKKGLRKLVEDFFTHNYRDITKRDTLEWGEPGKDENGNSTIRYKYRAKIWDKDTVTNNEVFTFDPQGKFVSAKKLYADSTDRLKTLVEKFFQENFRDITSRDTIEWGDVVAGDNGNTSIRYKYRAKIWDKETVTKNQVFTFNNKDEFVSVKDVKDTSRNTSSPAETVAGALKAISQCAEGDPRVTQAMADLHTIPSVQAVQEIVPYLDSKEDNLRRSAIYALWQGKFDDISPALPSLKKLLSHDEDLTRGMAALALGQNHATSSFDGLAEITAKDRSGYARRCGAYALGLLGDQRGKPILEKALEDSEKMVRNNAQRALDLLGSKTPSEPSGKTSISGWLEEESIDLDKVSLEQAPHTQIMIEDLQPDGTSRFRNVSRSIVQGTEPLKEIRFMNSDFVEVQRIVDADGNSIPFTTTHKNRHFQYAATLAKPIPPGGTLVDGSEGIMRNKVDEISPGVFKYHFTHSPGTGVPTRRVEVHRLPAGAELLDVSENATSRVRNGRTEIVLDEIVPANGSSTLNYQYKLAANIGGGGKGATGGGGKGGGGLQAAPSAAFLQLLNDDQRKVLNWTDRQFRSFFDNRTFDGWPEEDRSNLEKKLIDTLNGPLTREYYQAIGTLAALHSSKALSKLRELAFNHEDKDCRDRWMAVRALGIIGDKQSIPDLIQLVYHGNTNTRWWAQITLVRLTEKNFGTDWNAWGKWWNDEKGEPSYKPEIIRWWSGQSEPEKLAETLAENDKKFLEKLP